VLTVYKVTADREVSQTLMDVYGTIADVWVVCRTVGGSVSQDTRKILESCGLCSFSKVNPYPPIGIFLKRQSVFLHLFPELLKRPVPFIYCNFLPIYGNVVVVPLSNVLIILEHGSGLYEKFGFVGEDQWIL
jgi:hypothetical protein